MEPTPEPTAERALDALRALPDAFLETRDRIRERIRSYDPRTSARCSTWEEAAGRIRTVLAATDPGPSTAERELERLRVDYSILWRLTLGRTGETTTDDATLTALAERAEELLKLSVTDRKMDL
jgi:hypothetical protein